MKVVTEEPKTYIATVQEAIKILDTASLKGLYVELKEVSPGKYIIPPNLLIGGIGITLDGKTSKEQGIGTYPKGTLGFANVQGVGAGGIGILMALGSCLGMDFRNTDTQAVIKYICIIHDDTGNNRQISMWYHNATINVDIIQRATITLAPDLIVPIFPHILDNAGAYHPTYPGMGSAVVIDDVNNLTIQMPDLADGQRMILNIAYTIIVHD